MRDLGASPRPGTPALLVAALCVPLLACWEEPVDEALEVCIAAGGEVVATARATITRDTRERKALGRRLAETRRAYEQGMDPWSRRFAALAPVRERFTWEREEGDLVRAVRTVVLTDENDLPRLFGELDAAAALVVRDGRGELDVTPGPAGSRAGAEQRRRVARELEAWSVEVAAYEAALSALYRYLDGHPGETRASLAAMLHEALPDGVAGEAGEPSEEAIALVEAVRTARRRVLRILDVDEGEEATLNELAREVYDPFPARITVVLPARPEESEGFVAEPDGTLAIPRMDFLAALGRLHDRWVRPDPLPDYVRALRDPTRRGLDLAVLTAAERRVEPVPDAAAVRDALAEALVPPARYLARWTAPAPPEDEVALPCWPSPDDARRP
jgi:hypothetical protein